MAKNEEEIKAVIEEVIYKLGRLSWDNLKGKPDEINYINKLLKEVYECLGYFPVQAPLNGSER